MSSHSTFNSGALRAAMEQAKALPDTTTGLRASAASHLRAASSEANRGAVKAAWDAYVEASMSPDVSNLDAMAAAIEAYHQSLAA